MQFFAAIQSGFRNYANFKGRADRASYWWWVLFSVLIQAAASGFGEAFANLVSVAVLLPSLAFAIRRMHDTNRSGWWILLPIVNLVFTLQRSQPSENRFGPPPPPRTVA
ncbi:MAG: DUF805 domain-containing protein [Ilumatobacteraceae bacterium]|nr:hypothetical protein LBMAG03_04720 [Actinomycetes bacterium]